MKIRLSNLKKMIREALLNEVPVGAVRWAASNTGREPEPERTANYMDAIEVAMSTLHSRALQGLDVEEMETIHEVYGDLNALAGPDGADVSGTIFPIQHNPAVNRDTALDQLDSAIVTLASLTRSTSLPEGVRSVVKSAHDRLKNILDQGM